MGRRWRWTKRRKAVRTLLQGGQDENGKPWTADRLKDQMAVDTRKRGTRKHWRESEIVAAIGEWHRDIGEVAARIAHVPRELVNAVDRPRELVVDPDRPEHLGENEPQ